MFSKITLFLKKILHYEKENDIFQPVVYSVDLCGA